MTALKAQGKFIIGGAIIVLAVGYLIVSSIGGSTAYYLTVEEVKAKGPSEQTVRVAGIVMGETIEWSAQVTIRRIAGCISVNLRLRRFPAVPLLAKLPRLPGWFTGEIASENLRSLDRSLKLTLMSGLGSHARFPAAWEPPLLVACDLLKLSR